MKLKHVKRVKNHNFVFLAIGFPYRLAMAPLPHKERKAHLTMNF